MPRQAMLAIFGLLLVAAPGWSAQKSRPNIVLIMTDDQGYGDLSLHGNPHVRTPNLDRFARQGTQFTHFYVSPVCSPTRAALLTGRYPLRTGVWGVTHNKEAMRLDEITIAQILQAAGYRTACIGKWHNGEQYPYTPTGRGFDEFFGFHNGHWNNYFDAELLSGSRVVKTKGYISDVLTDRALQFIDDNKARPFFCYLAYNTPHSPFQTPDKYFERFKDLSAELASVYGMVENLDDNIGRVLARLDELGLRENTIVIFLTDNGASTDRYNAGMRGRKGSVHEGGGRVPFFIQWPGRFPQPRTVPQIAAHIDVLPTLLELCGVARPKNRALDGRSLVPLLKGKDAAWPERNLFTHQFRKDVGKFPGAVRTQKYRAVNEGKGWELYDMLNDPGQKKNLAATMPATLQPLAQAYEEWFKDVTHKGFARLAIPVGYAEENPVILHSPQALFDGGLKFHGGAGFANDWLTNWRSSKGRIWWDLDVKTAGTYKVSLSLLCPKEHAGSTIRLSAGKEMAEARVPAAAIVEVPLPHRVNDTKNTYINRLWATLEMGTVTLSPGPATMLLEATHVPGGQVMDLKDLRLELLSPKR